MTYVVRTSNPLSPNNRLTMGCPAVLASQEATLDGRVSRQPVRHRLGLDGVSDDGYWRPDVRAQFLTEDDAVVLMAYTGLVEQAERFARAAEANEPTEWGDQYMRLSIRFETAATR